MTVNIDEAIKETVMQFGIRRIFVNASNPCPLIDASASDLYTCFRKGLESEADLGRDDDGDYKLDTTEESVK